MDLSKLVWPGKKREMTRVEDDYYSPTNNPWVIEPETPEKYYDQVVRAAWKREWELDSATKRRRWAEFR